MDRVEWLVHPYGIERWTQFLPAARFGYQVVGIKLYTPDQVYFEGFSIVGLFFVFCC
jgi:hypothetical protein